MNIQTRDAFEFQIGMSREEPLRSIACLRFQKYNKGQNINSAEQITEHLNRKAETAQ